MCWRLLLACSGPPKHQGRRQHQLLLMLLVSVSLCSQRAVRRATRHVCAAIADALAAACRRARRYAHFVNPQASSGNAFVTDNKSPPAHTLVGAALWSPLVVSIVDCGIAPRCQADSRICAVRCVTHGGQILRRISHTSIRVCTAPHPCLPHHRSCLASLAPALRAGTRRAAVLRASGTTHTACSPSSRPTGAWPSTPCPGGASTRCA
jgi:hypothetical protein